MKGNSMKTILKSIKAVLMTAFLMAGIAGCTEVDKVRHNLSDEADNFNIQTVIKLRTDTHIFEMEAAFALNTSSRCKLEIPNGE